MIHHRALNKDLKFTTCGIRWDFDNSSVLTDEVTCPECRATLKRYPVIHMEKDQDRLLISGEAVTLCDPNKSQDATGVWNLVTCPDCIRAGVQGIMTKLVECGTIRELIDELRAQLRVDPPTDTQT